MPNYCDSQFKVFAKTPEDEGVLLKFYIDLATACGSFGGIPEKLRTHGEPDDGDVWGYGWFGNLFVGAGYTVDEIISRDFHIRGWDTTVDYLKGVCGRDYVSIQTTMAWSPSIGEMWTLIAERYEDRLDMFALAEEPGCEIYINTDETGEFFTDKYVVDYSSKEEGEDREYFGIHDEGLFVKLINKLTGGGWSNAAEIFAHEGMILEEFQSANPEEEGYYLNFYEFTPYF